MSDNDSDITQRKNHAEKTPQSEDVTRIAPADNTDSGDDKTRIAPVENLDDDKTRIAPAKNTEVVGEDVTRVAPAQNNAKLQAARKEVHELKLRQAQLKLEQLKKRRQKEQDLRHIQAQSEPPQDDVTRFNPKVASASAASVSAKRPAESDNEKPQENKVIEVGEHGTLKERFILEKVLGAGGMGIVYKAKDLLKVEAQDRDPYVAIKVLSDEFKSHPEAFISLQRESRKSQRIAHPNIVNVYDFDRDGDTVFMTMEFLDGSPLDKLIRQYKSIGLPTDDAWGIIRSISSALSHAHAEKIIHSDFKPGNIFVTKRGLAKVFDFGIARAVAQVEHFEDDSDDKTVFDAGNLGALTPAYASLEMLEGEEPDIRDDIYALGCVAYELLTGEHPYNKVPANEAEKQGLKPKRIANIKKYEWLAIKKAIAFRREDRVATVDEFLDLISPRIRSYNRLLATFAFLVSVSIAGYFMFFNDSVDPYSEFDIRNELELKIKIDFLKEDLISLINSAAFTDPWQDSIWKDVSDLKILTEGKDRWLDEQQMVIYQLYLKKIAASIDSYEYTKARNLIQNAQRYSDESTQLNILTDKMALAIEQGKTQKEEQARLRQAKLLEQQKKNRSKQKKEVVKVKKFELFNVALDNVNAQTKCQGRLKMRNIEAAVDKLRELNMARYKKLESEIVNSLAACIVQTGKAFPERAAEAKKHALRIFKSNRVLTNIKIQGRDPCDISLAGLGSRGKRALCKDKIKNTGSTGPVLVVIPGNKKIKAFAIGKYEVSARELNKFCKKSSVCSLLKGDVDLPASEIRFKVAKAYLKWLSKQTKQKYRLPTKNEWVYAAKSRRKKLDANRNCMLSTRGIQKGNKLVKTGIGKQNSWGLVNYVGNVQEWVYDKGRKLVAVGGSYEHSMNNCNLNTVNPHNGAADMSTGFRVVRELRIGL
ncbi:Serine/threonine protein kinase [hydrothermal vent metagenome]|uniref:Serine/threonine protein kinase n=1 Tax=hydrothermal vent metagenome TaxID=652676 RepID=A0A3B0Y1T9_9ZZZZ